MLRITESIKAGFLITGLNAFFLNLNQNSMLSKYVFALNFYLKLLDFLIKTLNLLNLNLDRFLIRFILI